MSLPPLPPLPEPNAGPGLAWQIYTADQMRAYGAAEYRRALEDAAKEADHWQSISDRNNKGHKCGAYVAAAIRAMKDKTT